MASLATTDEFATRLKTTFDTEQSAQAQLLLDEATGLVRSATGGQTLTVVTGDTIEFEPPAGLWLDLPQRPVIQVTEVQVNGQVVDDWRLVGDRLFRRYGWDGRWRWGSWYPVFPQVMPFLVSITYDHGFQSDDERFSLAKSACMVLAAQAVANLNGVGSESIDDYRVVFRPDAAPLEMTDNLEKRLRRTYGRTASSIAPQVRL